MRKLTPAEREAKRLARANALANVAPVAEVAPVEEAPEEVAPVVEETPVVEVAPVVEEAPTAEVPSEDASSEEVLADEKPKRKSTKKADAETTSEEG